MSAVKDALLDEGKITFGTPYKQQDEQSTRSIQAVIQAVQQRFPDWADQCIPYTNVLTFQQWLKRGYGVKKGEKSIRIPIMREIEDKDDPKRKQLIRRTSCLFAFPQVEKKDDESDELEHMLDNHGPEDCTRCAADAA